MTRGRVLFAFAVALATDALQVMLGPLGFHPLLLPTFVVEFFPVVDMLPTWTACTAMVVVLRTRAQSKAPVIKPAVTVGEPVDVEVRPVPNPGDKHA